MKKIKKTVLEFVIEGEFKGNKFHGDGVDLFVHQMVNESDVLLERILQLLDNWMESLPEKPTKKVNSDIVVSKDIVDTFTKQEPPNKD